MMDAKDFKWDTFKHPDGTKILRGYNGNRCIDILPLDSGRFSFVIRSEGYDYMPSEKAGHVTTWATKQEAKQSGIKEFANY